MVGGILQPVRENVTESCRKMQVEDFVICAVQQIH